MKKTLPAILLLCALALAVSLAATARTHGDDVRVGASGLDVTGFDWRYEGYLPVEIVDSGRTGMTTSVKRNTRYVFKYVAKLTLRNAGAKAVKAVEWDHLFVEREGGKELKRYHLQAKQQIAAGVSRTLSKEVFIKPEESTRHISEGVQKVRVTRVEFADGTVWRAEEK
jgi:predicted small secreted protein